MNLLQRGNPAAPRALVAGIDRDWDRPASGQAAEDVMDEERLIAVYESHAVAEAVRRKLIVSGVDPSAVEVANAAPADAGSAADGSFASKGFWAKLKDLASIPGRQGHAYENAVTHAPAIVMLSPPAASRAHMIALLESTDPLAFNARAEEP
jgi:hypothetical protein